LSLSFDKTIKLWNLKLNESIRTYEGHENLIICLKKTHVNKIISADWNGTVKIWDMDTGECLKTIDGKGNINDNGFYRIRDMFSLLLERKSNN